MATTRVRNSNNPYPLRIDTGINYTAISRSIPTASQNIQAPKPQRPAQQMHIRHLDGTPYGTKPRSGKAVVAKDMYNGQEPPQYKSKASYSDLRQSSTSNPHQPASSCDTCGRGRSSSDINAHATGINNECNKCGKRKAVTSEPIQDTTIPQPQPRSVSEASGSTFVNTNSSTSSTENVAPAAKRKCTKCGRAKKPVTSAPQTTAAPNGLSFPAPPPASHIASQHLIYTRTADTPLRPGSTVPRRKPIPGQLIPGYRSSPDIDIDVIPPTAVSEHPQPNVLRDTPIDNAPLLSSTQQKHQSSPKPRRSTSITSIASSITRSLTNRRRRSRDSTDNNTSPKRQSTESNGAGHLINMITSAIRGTGTQDYSRLGGESEIDRRSNHSPFSFTSKAGDDNTAFELGKMSRPSPSPSTAATTNTNTNGWSQVELDDNKTTANDYPSPSSSTNSTTKNPFADPSATKTSLLHDLEKVTLTRPTHTLVSSHTTSAIPPAPRTPDAENDVFLATRPTELTRFQSLRSGVQRAGSVARSSSLKRFNSLKHAPQLWYRTDMAFEGAASVGVY